jgi:peptidoglycan LD-endopeptidase LytH
MSLGIADRLLTVVVTATLTSAAWIVIGSQYLVAPEPIQRTAEPPGMAPTPSVASGAGTFDRLLVPVEGVGPGELTDSFADPRSGAERLHEAIDIMAPLGTPVLAAAAGVVEKLFQSDEGGNTLYVRSEDGWTLYYYAHLAAYAPGLSEGRRVSRGERVGAVGSTGNADPSAPHLHFAVLRTTPEAQWWEPAAAVNPYPLLTGP